MFSTKKEDEIRRIALDFDKQESLDLLNLSAYSR
jgi:hypothetical protein